MVSVCTSCDISGGENFVEGVDTLDECKSRCLRTPSCKAIDFGKGSRVGQCYLNNRNSDYGSHSRFDAWKKTTVCGN